MTDDVTAGPTRELSLDDPEAQDLLWEFALRTDNEPLKTALRRQGFKAREPQEDRERLNRVRLIMRKIAARPDTVGESLVRKMRVGDLASLLHAVGGLTTGDAMTLSKDEQEKEDYVSRLLTQNAAQLEELEKTHALVRDLTAKVEALDAETERLVEEGTRLAEWGVKLKAQIDKLEEPRGEADGT